MWALAVAVPRERRRCGATRRSRRSPVRREGGGRRRGRRRHRRGAKVGMRVANRHRLMKTRRRVLRGDSPRWRRRRARGAWRARCRTRLARARTQVGSACRSLGVSRRARAARCRRRGARRRCRRLRPNHSVSIIAFRSLELRYVSKNRFGYDRSFQRTRACLRRLSRTFSIVYTRATYTQSHPLSNTGKT